MPVAVGGVKVMSEQQGGAALIAARAIGARQILSQAEFGAPAVIDVAGQKALVLSIQRMRAGVAALLDFKTEAKLSALERLPVVASLQRGLPIEEGVAIKGRKQTALEIDAILQWRVFDAGFGCRIVGIGIAGRMSQYGGKTTQPEAFGITGV